MILLATLALIFYRVKSISAGEGVDLPNCPGFDGNNINNNNQKQLYLLYFQLNSYVYL